METIKKYALHIILAIIFAGFTLIGINFPEHVKTDIENVIDTSIITIKSDSTWGIDSIK